MYVPQLWIGFALGVAATLISLGIWGAWLNKNK